MIACDIGNQGTPSERVAIGKAIEDEIRQRAEARRNSRLKHSSIVVEDLPQQEEGKSRDQVAEIWQRAKERQIALAGTRPSKGDLPEDLPEGITGESRDQVAEIVGTA